MTTTVAGNALAEVAARPLEWAVAVAWLACRLAPRLAPALAGIELDRWRRSPGL